MKKLLPLIFISTLIYVITGCFFPAEEPEEYYVYYVKGSSKSGSVPVDNNIYTSGDRITVLGKGTLKNEEYEFLGWEFNSKLYKPGETLSFSYSRDVYFIAAWDDGSDTPFNFKIENDEAKIIKYTGSSSSDVTIPLTYQGKPVTEIGNDAFRNRSIKSVKLNENIKKIGTFTFSNSGLTSLDIPDSVESIGAGAFQNNKLNKISFGSGLTSILIGAFSENNLLTVNIPANIVLIENGAFYNNEIEQIIIGAGVEIVSDTSFGTHGASFKEFYEDNGKSAGEYNFVIDIWVKTE